MSDAKRIQTLDAFRFLSITLVVFFHYLTRWTQPMQDANYYPYGARYADFPLFNHGGVGVEFFFIISGFVIIFTLERTRTIKDFLIRRLIRLWPTMLLCSIVTFIVVKLADANHQFPAFEIGLKNFLPSLSFSSPSFWNVQFIDSAYWSLEIEVKFYIWAAVLYFLSKKNFLYTWTGLTLLVLVPAAIWPSLKTSFLFEYLFFPQFLPFFTAGVLFYSLFKGEHKGMVLGLLPLLLIAGMATRPSLVDKLFIIVFFALFLLFVYKDKWLEWMNRPVIIAIGVASYPLYLLHQHVGVILIYRLAKAAPLPGHWILLYPLIVYSIMCVGGYLIYRNYELPVKRLLMRITRQHKPLPVVKEAALVPLSNGE